MQIRFEHYGNFFCSFLHEDGMTSDFHKIGAHDLKTCADFIEFKMKADKTIMNGIIMDYDTGELVAIIGRGE